MYIYIILNYIISTDQHVPAIAHSVRIRQATFGQGVSPRPAQNGLFQLLRGRGVGMRVVLVREPQTHLAGFTASEHDLLVRRFVSVDRSMGLYCLQ